LSILSIISSIFGRFFSSSFRCSSIISHLLLLIRVAEKSFLSYAIRPRTMQEAASVHAPDLSRQ
jgi:hypothetical protein